MQINPPLIVANRSEMVEKVKNSNSEKCFVGLEYSVMAPAYKRHCDLAFIPDSYGIGNPQFYAYLVNKATILPQAIPDVLATFSVMNLFSFLMEKHFDQEIPFDCDSTGRKLLRPLTIWNCLDQFYLFLLGCAIAAVSIGVERKMNKRD